MSAVLNNTPIVAMFLPVIRELSRRQVRTWVFGVGDLELDERGRVVTRARLARSGARATGSSLAPRRSN